MKDTTPAKRTAARTATKTDVRFIMVDAAVGGEGSCIAASDGTHAAPAGVDVKSFYGYRVVKTTATDPLVT